jgi:dephospho-CoA kinase
LGESAYQSDGKLNRPFVASEIFSDKKLQRRVEAIIHPRVSRERTRRIQNLINEGQKIIVIESALIFETGLDRKLDLVLVVAADENKRISRVCARDNVSEDPVRNRIAAQLNAGTALKKADYVIYNNGTLEELESKARFMYNVFTHLINEEKSA